MGVFFHNVFFIQSAVCSLFMGSTECAGQSSKIKKYNTQYEQSNPLCMECAKNVSVGNSSKHQGELPKCTVRKGRMHALEPK